MSTMETRVAELEAELRTLKQTVAALAPALAESVLRGMAARGTLLVVKTPTEEMAEIVARSAAHAPEEIKSVMVDAREDQAEKEEETATATQEKAKATAKEVQLAESEGKKEPAVIGLEDKDDGEPRGSLMVEETEEQSMESAEVVIEDDQDEEEVDQRMDVDTSQESSPGGSSSNADSDVGDTLQLSLSAFDDVVSFTGNMASLAPPPPSAPVRVPSRPPVIMPIKNNKCSKKQRSSKTKSDNPAVVPATESWSNLPEDFEVQTKDSVAIAWEKWCCGEAARGIPPLRSLTSKQVVVKTVNRRLSDLRCAMLPIEIMAQTNGMWRDDFTPREAAAVFAELENHLPFFAATPSSDGRKRKKEIAWSTALNNMRKKRKQQGLL